MTRQRDESSGEYMRKLTPEEQRIVDEVRKSVMSRIDISKMLPDINISPPKFDSPILDAIKEISSVHIKPFADLTKPLTVNLPNFHLEFPALSVDYARLFGPALNLQNLGLYRTIDTSSLQVFGKIYEDQRRHFEKIFNLSGIRKAIDSLFPPNWRGVKSRGMSDFDSILLDEGLALAWVPDAPLLQKLFDASTRQERRRLIGRRWKLIMKSCRSELITVTDPDSIGYCEFALKCIDSIEIGGHEAGQALAANLLDTMLRETLDGANRRLVTNQGNRLNLDDLPIRASIVFGGIWGSFTEFWAHRGDSVPRGFSRHASAHAVGKRQYSRINAVIAVMHVTAYIKLLASGDLNL
ncbi:hypothetical protein [Nocardia wallacei]|uniref:hypothetical protein n=1 Tax=Nocardia wallacei TaxID=480035 RepID=UPI00245565FC|nr:hypothetical protein [Nocardia wallacei]